MTADERAVKEYYGADKHIYCAGQFDPDRPPHSITGYAIISALEPQIHMGYGRSHDEAWADAAKRIEGMRRTQ